MAGLLKRLQEKEGFSETERIVADYMLEHFRELANFSTRQLAKNTFTSSAAIVRFSQKLGFEGYADFKIRFLAEMMQQTSEPKERFFSEKDTIPDIIDKIMHMGTGAIKETHDLLEPASIVRTLHLLSKAKYVDFYATGNNLHTACMMSDGLVLAGKYSTVHMSMAMQYLQAKDVPKDHLSVFITRTGENRLLAQIAQELHRQGNSILCITARPKSTIASLADEVLRAVSAEDMEEGGPRIFLMSSFYILNVIWAALVTRSDLSAVHRKSEWLAKNFHY